MVYGPFGLVKDIHISLGKVGMEKGVVPAQILWTMKTFLNFCRISPPCRFQSRKIKKIQAMLLPRCFYWSLFLFESKKGQDFKTWAVYPPGVPFTYFSDGGRGIRGIFWGLKFWPTRNIFGSMKDAGYVLGREKTLASAQISNKRN